MLLMIKKSDFTRNSFFISYLLFLLCIIVTASCESSEKEKVSEAVAKETVEELSKEAKLKRKVETHLGIPANENYDFQVYYEYLDQDTLIDAVILVNRYAFALQKYEQDGNMKFLEYMGFSGPHNYVFVQLGNSDKLLDSQPIGSSIDTPLEVEFDFITSMAQKDFWVEYRLKNSLYRNYYRVHKGGLELTFNCPVFDNIGDDIPIAYHIQHKESAVRVAKDIFMYFGEIKNYNPSKIEDVNNFTPEEIVKTDSLFVFFIFNEKTGKYVTPYKKHNEED